MRLALAIVFTVALLIAFAAPAAAADIRSGDSITIGASETINDDLYAFGNTVTILGTVRGDVIAAGATVQIDGTVSGSVMGAANSYSIRGPIGGSVRIAGNILSIDGKVTGDVVAAGSALTIGSSGRVGRDLILAAGTATLVGETARDARGSAGALTVDGHVGGAMSVEVTTLRLTDRAVVDGSISYGSATDAAIAPGANVKGTIERHAPRQQTQPTAQGPVVTLIDVLRALVGFLALGLLLLLVAPRFMHGASARLTTNPWASLGIGVAILIGLPIVAILAIAIGAIVGGWWLGLVALAAYVIAIVVSVPVAGLTLGDWILARTGTMRQIPVALALGVIVLVVIGTIPVVGGLIVFLAVLFGLGAIGLALGGARETATPAAR